MRKLSITLALIVTSCTILNAAILEQKNIILEIRTWDTEERTPPYIPINAFYEKQGAIFYIAPTVFYCILHCDYFNKNEYAYFNSNTHHLFD